MLLCGGSDEWHTELLIRTLFPPNTRLSLLFFRARIFSSREATFLNFACFCVGSVSIYNCHRALLASLEHPSADGPTRIRITNGGCGFPAKNECRAIYVRDFLSAASLLSLPLAFASIQLFAGVKSCAGCACVCASACQR